MRALIATLLFLGCSLPAVSGETHFGLQATASMPQGDLGGNNYIDGKLGYGLGLQTEICLKNGWSIVPRIDYTTYSNENTKSQSVQFLPPGPYSFPLPITISHKTSHKAKIIFGGTDLRYYFNVSNTGFFLLSGLGFSSGKIDLDDSGQTLGWTGSYNYLTNVQIQESTSKTSFYVSLGLGAKFTNGVGAELRFITLNKYSATVNSISSPSLNFSTFILF